MNVSSLLSNRSKLRSAHPESRAAIGTPGVMAALLFLFSFAVWPCKCYSPQSLKPTRLVNTRRVLLNVASASFGENDSAQNRGISSIRRRTSIPIEKPMAQIRRSRDIIRKCLSEGHAGKAIQEATCLTEAICETLLMFPANEQASLCSSLDSIYQMATEILFASPFQSSRVIQGLDIVNLQINKKELIGPYHLIPRRTLSRSLTALTSLAGKSIHGDNDLQTEAFRILQRLVSGNGVRGHPPRSLPESMFARVMRSFCDAGRMDMAHRVVALQERTSSAPPLSAVTYSILVKGYGRLQETNHVDWLVTQVKEQDIQADTILLNSIIDAYVNCNALDKAETIFREMKTGVWPGAQPNTRTYNTVLKGYAESHKLDDAIALVSKMRKDRFWDAVSTNTFVHAAVGDKQWQLAESILAQATVRNVSKSQHPNVEAYSKLIDGYGRNNKLAESLEVLRSMEQRNVQPNEVTYACLLRWLGVYGKVELGRKVLQKAETRLGASSKCYHSFVSGLVADGPAEVSFDETGVCFDVRLNSVLALVRHMVIVGVQPSSATVAILVDSLSKCKPPRTSEAKSFFNMLQSRNVISPSCVIVNTALIKAYGNEKDFTGVLESFQQMTQPDTIAVNAFLNACLRCDQGTVLVKSFDFHFNKSSLKPDAISYSMVLSSCFNEYSVRSFAVARTLFREMKTRRKIKPDKAMVDMILKSFLRPQTVSQLKKVDIDFLSTVWQDALVSLDWDDEQANRRTRSLRSVLSSQIQAAYGSINFIDSLFPFEFDPLFQRKGWNQVDSGFRLWDTAKVSETKPMDSFLLSKGWNDVDSSFRLL